MTGIAWIEARVRYYRDPTAPVRRGVLVEGSPSDLYELASHIHSRAKDGSFQLNKREAEALAALLRALEDNPT